MEDQLDLTVNARLLLLEFARREIEKGLVRAQNEFKKEFTELMGEEPPPIEVIHPFLGTELPRFQRYAFIAMLVSLLETLMEEHCRLIGEREGFPINESYDAVKDTLKRQRGNLGRCKQFLSRHIEPRVWEGMVKLWEKLDILISLRDCILHAGGVVSRVRQRDSNRIIAFAKTGSELFTIENDVISLTEEQCQRVWQRAAFIVRNVIIV